MNIRDLQREIVGNDVGFSYWDGMKHVPVSGRVYSMDRSGVRLDCNTPYYSLHLIGFLFVYDGQRCYRNRDGQLVPDCHVPSCLETLPALSSAEQPPDDDPPDDDPPDDDPPDDDSHDYVGAD